MADAIACIGEVAARQHGLITLAQLLATGISRRTFDRVIAHGHLLRVAAGVYVVNGAPESALRRVLLERLAAGADAVVSHRTGAAVYELDGFDLHHRLLHVTVPLGRNPRARQGVRIHRSPDHGLIRPRTQQGITVADPARVILDLYASEPNPEVARRGLFSARKKRLVTWAELGECLEVHARKGRHGVAAFREDVELYSRIGTPESPFEDEIRALLADAGLPEPELQHEVNANGSRYRIDVAYPALKIGIEGKSKAHHLTDVAFETDSVRDADLAIAGWLMIHVTSAQRRRDPAGVVRRIRQAISRRAGLAA